MPHPHHTRPSQQDWVDHSNCVVCSLAHPTGLRVEFDAQSDGCVEATFAGGADFEGYPGLLHGGVTAALLDGAMTHCLFASGCQGVTADLRVRYRHPVLASQLVNVRACLMERHGPLFLLKAELRQDGRVKATALGKFMPFRSHPLSIAPDRPLNPENRVTDPITHGKLRRHDLS